MTEMLVLFAKVIAVMFVIDVLAGLIATRVSGPGLRATILYGMPVISALLLLWFVVVLAELPGHEPFESGFAALAVLALVGGWLISVGLTDTIKDSSNSLKSERLAANRKVDEKYVRKVFEPSATDLKNAVADQTAEAINNSTDTINASITKLVNDVQGMINANREGMEEYSNNAAQSFLNAAKHMNELNQNRSRSESELMKAVELIKELESEIRDNTAIKRRVANLEDEVMMMRAQLSTIIENQKNGDQDDLLEEQTTHPQKNSDRRGNKNEVAAEMAKHGLELLLAPNAGQPDILGIRRDGEFVPLAYMCIKRQSLTEDNRQRRIGRKEARLAWNSAKESSLPLVFHVTNSANGRIEMRVVEVSELEKWEGFSTSTKLVSDDEEMIQSLKFDYDHIIERFGGRL